MYTKYLCSFTKHHQSAIYLLAVIFPTTPAIFPTTPVILSEVAARDASGNAVEKPALSEVEGTP